MKIENTDKQQIMDLIRQAKHVAVVPSKVVGADAYCAAAGLYHMLLESGKEATLVHEGKVPTGCEDLVTESDVSANVSERDLIVTIDYSNLQNATSAHYSTDNDVLTIRIGPVPKDFDSGRVKSKVTGFNFDLVFVIGAQGFVDLGTTFRNLQSEFERAKVINIDITNRNERFGVANVIDTTADSLSTLVFSESILWGLTPGKKSARAFLTGIAHRD